MSDEIPAEIADRLYTRSTEAVDLLRWLYENGKLSFADASEAQKLGIEHFEYLADQGVIPEGWSDITHNELEDWAIGLD
ncbi:MAG: hypothetical protein HYX29_01295 [Solirubrobacterales bacterium]|nr:hypothetical protein [Solirubrobacterales bacterium]